MDFPHSCHLPPRREAPRVANCTWRPGSSIWGHWCLASPLPASFSLCAWVSSFSVAHKYLQLLHALANWINLHIFLGQRRACPTLVLRNREEQFLTPPSPAFIPISLKERRGERKKQKKGRRRGRQIFWNVSQMSKEIWAQGLGSEVGEWGLWGQYQYQVRGWRAWVIPKMDWPITVVPEHDVEKLKPSSPGKGEKECLAVYGILEVKWQIKEFLSKVISVDNYHNHSSFI